MSRLCLSSQSWLILSFQITNCVQFSNLTQIQNAQCKFLGFVNMSANSLVQLITSETVDPNLSITDPIYDGCQAYSSNASILNSSLIRIQVSANTSITSELLIYAHMVSCEFEFNQLIRVPILLFIYLSFICLSFICLSIFGEFVQWTFVLSRHFNPHHHTLSPSFPCSIPLPSFSNSI